ncbi:MAG: UvrD-helicase domain-containing protein [Lentisphaerae bacterium]|nr:UvrD-helicase domain-containing protein [Lentisphaerota bacterium]
MSIVYNASAGTGKTFQVTQLYEKLVMEDGIEPRKILLMTFTDNAAAELRMRVAHRLLKARRSAEAADDIDQIDRAVKASAQLSSAPIGTIHAFCTRLLREHALSAGLSPGFLVLAGDERDEPLNRICREELLAHLEHDPDFKTFCAGAHLIGSGQSFGSSITETVPNLIEQAGSLGISLEEAESLLPPPVPTVSRIDFELICKRIRELPKITPAVQSALDIIQQAITESADVETLVQRLNELGIQKFGRGAKSISDDFWALKTAVEEAVEYRKRFPAACAFARYIQAVARCFREWKHSMNAVDFDDQLHLAAQLLESEKAETTFRYIIVDEVQDTSRIQCDIIQALWRTGAELVICGDKKQSIYTWRGADPQVMPDLQNAILSADGEMMHLNTSYRSKSQILDVINPLFSAVYGTADYTPDDHLQPHPDFTTDGEKPCVEFLTPDDTEERSKEEKTAAEMAAVANRIRLLVEGPTEWQPAYRYNEGFKPTSANNAYRYSDILILLRRTTHQAALEHALRLANIPYTLGGKGSGLFSRQETRDVALFLNILTNPADAFSLIGFLRSPWVGLSDETIAELAWSNNGFSVDHLMARYAEKTDIIDRYRALLGSKLASELVRMLIEETAYDALLAGLPRGEQRLANLRKVIDWLRETERGAQTTSAAVARRLSEQIVNPPKIPEAALLDPAQNAVTIMTVHSAKGLTQRVVFVPDISFSEQNDHSFAQVFFDEKQQPKLALRVTAPDRSQVKSPGFEAAAKYAVAVRAHESKNLFYVAMTRARDLVVTSASVGRSPSGWLKSMEPLIGTAIPSIPYSALSTAASAPTHSIERNISAEPLLAAFQSLPPAPARPTLQRIPATRLAKEQDEAEPDDEETAGPILRTAPVSTALGSLGHAVLEQLALNNWAGSISDWLERLRDDFELSRTQAEALIERIEQTRSLMIQLTSDVEALRPEFPFVLHHENNIIDGTIDLLCRMSDGFAIFDYKFTEAEDSAILAQYKGQMELYRLAAHHAFPNAARAQITLIIISAAGPRQLPVHLKSSA